MDWGAVSGAIVALIGGTGVAGVLSGSLELSRRNRLRRSMKKSLELLQMLPSSGPAKESLDYVVRLEGARYLSLNVVGPSKAVKQYLAVYLVLLLVALAGVGLYFSSYRESEHGVKLTIVDPLLQPVEQAVQLISVGVALAAMVCLTALALTTVTRLKRDEFVSAVMKRSDPDREVLHYQQQDLGVVGEVRKSWRYLVVTKRARRAFRP